MIILRNITPPLRIEQREFGNKENKAKLRAWKIEQGAQSRYGGKYGEPDKLANALENKDRVLHKMTKEPTLDIYRSTNTKQIQKNALRAYRRNNQPTGDILSTPRTKAERLKALSPESREQVYRAANKKHNPGISLGKLRNQRKLAQEGGDILAGYKGTKAMRISRLSPENQVKYYRNVEIAKNPSNYINLMDPKNTTPEAIQYRNKYGNNLDLQKQYKTIVDNQKRTQRQQLANTKDTGINASINNKNLDYQQRVQNLSPKNQRKLNDLREDRLEREDIAREEKKRAARRAEMDRLDAEDAKRSAERKARLEAERKAINDKPKSSGIVSKTSTWIKRNPKLATGGAIGLAALGTAGIIGYNHYKNKQNKNN